MGRLRALLAIWRIGSDAKDSVPVLMQSLKSEDVAERQLAAGALIKIDPGNKAARDILIEAVPDLINDLEDLNEGIPAFAADVLGRIGSKAKAAIPALTKVLKNDDPEVRKAASEALKRIDRK